MAGKKNNTAIKNSPKHLLGIQSLSIIEAKEILEEAKEFIKLNRSNSKKLDILRGKTQINLFFEPSTRTQSSFELAGKRLGADVMSMNAVPFRNRMAIRGWREHLYDVWAIMHVC